MFDRFEFHAVTAFFLGLSSPLSSGLPKVASVALALAAGLEPEMYYDIIAAILAEPADYSWTPAVLAAEDGRTIHRYGPYAFGEVHIIEIARPGMLG